MVPACAQDAARIARGERPDLRRVRIGGQMLPYWEAGAAYLPLFLLEGVAILAEVFGLLIVLLK